MSQYQIDVFYSKPDGSARAGKFDLWADVFFQGMGPDTFFDRVVSKVKEYAEPEETAARVVIWRLLPRPRKKGSPKMTHRLERETSGTLSL